LAGQRIFLPEPPAPQQEEAMQITQQELATLSVYCVSANSIARLLSRAARRTSDIQLRLALACRANAALHHAELWADAIRAVGGAPKSDAVDVLEAYAQGGPTPGCIIEGLVLTQLTERRLAKQMLRHFREPDTHPLVRAVLRRMIEEESSPGWCTPWIERYGANEADRVREVQRRFAVAERALAQAPDAEQTWKKAA
jgi:hypothetical protein